MTANSRQIQLFSTRPTFVWKFSECIESYTFKLEKKESPYFLIWEDTFTSESNWKGTKGIDLELITLENIKYLVLPEVSTLSELIMYSISGIGKSKDQNIYAYSDIIVLESRVRDSIAKLEEEINGLENPDSRSILKDTFKRFVDNASSFTRTGPVPPWTRGTCVYMNHR
jgi:hypothetical protein